MGNEMFQKKRLLFILLLALLLPLILLIWNDHSFSKSADFQRDPESKQVVMVVLNAVELEDLTVSNTPSLHKLANQVGALGLMNTRTAGGMNAVNNYLTIGAGVKAAGGRYGGLAFNTDEEYEFKNAGNVYRDRTGVKMRGARVVNLGIANVSRSSRSYKLDIYPGSLGKALKSAGLETAVIGNADILAPDNNEMEFHREVSLIGMDNLGRVPLGNVGQDMREFQPQFVGGLKTDYERLLSETSRLLPRADLLVIETGDTARLDHFSSFLLDWQIPKKKQEILKQADQFVDRLVHQIDLDNTLLIVVSPMPSRAMRYQGNNLNPLILAGPGIKPGVLTSATTRRHGIVDNTDIAPTVIGFLDAETPYYMSGRPLMGETQPRASTYLSRVLSEALIKSQIRVPVLTTYVTATALILVLSLIVLLMGERGSRYFKFSKLALLWAASAPVAMLLGAAFAYATLVVPILASLAISIALVLFSSLFKKRPLHPVLVLALLTSGALVLDTVTGAHLMQRSLLGYCPIIGARFYGIGNEYMGVLIGSSIIGLTLFFDLFKLRSRHAFIAIGLLFIMITFVVGYQAFGANVGGAISSVVAFIVTFIAIIKGRISSRHTTIVVAAVLLFLLGFAALDLLRVGSNSHLGRAILLIQNGGLTEVFTIIQRKIAMNIKGTRYTSWTRILVASLVVFPTLFLRPIGAISKIRQQYPRLAAGNIGATTGAIIAFLVNDTGAAVAATIIIFAAVVTLYTLIEDQMSRDSILSLMPNLQPNQKLEQEGNE